MNNVLRVFYTIHKRVPGKCDYKKIKGHTDYHEHSNPKLAYESLANQYGQFFMDARTNRAPDQWVEIHSHTFIDPDRERVLIGSERLVEQSLFDGKTLFAAQGKKPEPNYQPRGKK